MNEIIQMIFELIIAVVIILVTKYLIPYIRNAAKSSEYSAIYTAVEDAVQMAEQTMKAKGAGHEKKEVVLGIINQFIAENNYEMSPEQINSMVESVVFLMNGGKKDVGVSESQKTTDE